MNLPNLISSTTGDTTHFGFDFDDAPAILVPNQTDPTGMPPGQDSSTVRDLEREVAATTEHNPITGTTVPITVNLADRRLTLLNDHIDLLRAAFRRVRARHPFTIEAAVIFAGPSAYDLDPPRARLGFRPALAPDQKRLLTRSNARRAYLRQPRL